MVFKSIERIKNALPEVIHIIMFYDNGIVFETTLDQTINIPKIGENFGQIVDNFKQIYDVANFNLIKYNKIIYETDDISIILIKLGEESNIALFFMEERSKEIKISAIMRYLKKIEKLIDMDKDEILLQELEKCEEQKKHLKDELKINQEKIVLLKEEEKNSPERIRTDFERDIEKKIEKLQQESDLINKKLSEKEIEYKSLKERVEKKES